MLLRKPASQSPHLSTRGKCRWPEPYPTQPINQMTNRFYVGGVSNTD